MLKSPHQAARHWGSGCRLPRPTTSNRNHHEEQPGVHIESLVCGARAGYVRRVSADRASGRLRIRLGDCPAWRRALTSSGRHSQYHPIGWWRDGTWMVEIHMSVHELRTKASDAEKITINLGFV